MARREEGYTVLESLIAFAILSVVLVTLYSAAGTLLRLVDRAARYSTITMLADSKLDEIAAFHGTLPEHQKGTFPGSDVQWDILATPHAGTSRPSERLVLQDVRLTLHWTDNLHDSDLALSTRHLGTLRP